MIHVCIPVLRRYDCLRDSLKSLERSTVPYLVHVVDNGRNDEKMREVGEFHCDVFTPERPLGVAESWNWFIKNIPEERVIVNDDVTFAPVVLLVTVLPAVTTAVPLVRSEP